MAECVYSYGGINNAYTPYVHKSESLSIMVGTRCGPLYMFWVVKIEHGMHEDQDQAQDEDQDQLASSRLRDD